MTSTNAEGLRVGGGGKGIIYIGYAVKEQDLGSFRTGHSIAKWNSTMICCLLVVAFHMHHSVSSQLHLVVECSQWSSMVPYCRIIWVFSVCCRINNYLHHS